MLFRLLLPFIICLNFSLIECKEVDVTFFYQARCPYCLRFIVEQLYPGYQKIGDKINVEFIPVVKKDLQTGKFSCTHGENECLISRAHACVFNRDGVTDKHAMEYMYCTEKPAYDRQMVTDAHIKGCVESTLNNIVTWETVNACMNSEESNDLLNKYHEKSIKENPKYVPWIVISGKHDVALESSAQLNFTQTINKLLVAEEQNKNIKLTLNLVIEGLGGENGDQCWKLAVDDKDKQDQPQQDETKADETQQEPDNKNKTDPQDDSGKLPENIPPKGCPLN